YAHPRNAFWPIIEALFDIPRLAPYARRLTLLQRRRIALWDVLQSCHRPGSLDSSITEETIVPNDFEQFFQRHRQIQQVFFNGHKAEQSFNRHVAPRLSAPWNALPQQRLPSTSPAHASLSLEEKLTQWHAVLEALSRADGPA
ncbi:MAG: DNA-deoxyinosine glycosylase, partial [Planctomycetaceae bacterium]|nr:DNA-deoxyinosine glycosylase [Planctomycetaceae bacterium]